MNERETLSTWEVAQTVMERYADLLDVYHEAYFAHHGEHGTIGCPCCAEFKPRIREAIAAVDVAISEWATAPR